MNRYKVEPGIHVTFELIQNVTHDYSIESSVKNH
jgi:hypothetical protein